MNIGKIFKEMYQKTSGKWNPITKHSILRSNVRKIKIMNIFMNIKNKIDK
jgi:hypothetical protein